MIIFYLILFLFGLYMGSFLNVLIERLPKSEKISGRSYCPHCKTKLSWFDLIPIFSFLILKGRCRYCRQKISWQYSVVEFATGALFVLNFWILNFGFDLKFVPTLSRILDEVGGFGNLDFLKLFYYLIITCFLIIIFFTDLKYYIIPDKIIYPAIIIAFFYNLTHDALLNHLTIKPLNHSLFFSGILAAFFIFIFFLLVFLVSRGKWLGFGDVKLAIFMGLLLGWPNVLVAALLAVFLGAIIGLGLIMAGKKRLRSEIPFGPFLVVGTFIALFWGKQIINWYLSLLG